MDTWRRDANRRREINVGKIGSVNAPPSIVRPAVEVERRVAGPRRPTSVLAHQNTLIHRIIGFENDDIRLEILELAAPGAGPIGSDGDELPGL
ncbi:hypothetical protein PHJA_001505500 [Phtheirospermum japonicum]|uniref:Uncharacterized protein n=1 Tax=Phtheirospermum japonicum TaxID=374723 RepID=A0A830CH03_9LAMI|nr:hypothetical protein PHJA_001505500 [Phtheirospermum japonicum]